jgi:hypothetical protein
MTVLTAVVHIGSAPPLGGGLRPRVVAHFYEDTLPRALAYEVTGDGTLERVPGAFAPDLDAERSYPVTDLLLATARDLSSIADRLNTLDTKARANYGSGFREKVFDSDTAWGSAGYGRHFEARSQLEAHPYEGRVVAGTHPDAGDRLRAALAANLDRLDAPTAAYERPVTARD